MHYKLLLTTALLVLFGITGIQAQQSLNAAGGNASGNQGTVSYSVGQLFYQSIHGSNGSVAQGVQHPYEIWVVTGIEQAEGISLMATAYPNPTSDQLILNIGQFDTHDLFFQIFDIYGKLLKKDRITTEQTFIDMASLAPDIYFVRISQANREVKTFKIIKK